MTVGRSTSVVVLLALVLAFSSAARAQDEVPRIARVPWAPSPAERDWGAGLWLAGAVQAVGLGVGVVLAPRGPDRLAAPLIGNVNIVAGTLAAVTGSALFAAGQARLDAYDHFLAGDDAPSTSLRDAGAVMTGIAGVTFVTGLGLMFRGCGDVEARSGPSCLFDVSLSVMATGASGLVVSLPILAAGQAGLDAWDEFLGGAALRLAIGPGDSDLRGRW